MKDKIFSVLQRIGRSFMLPIAILPVAGLLLGIGSSFTNATTIETYGLTKILGDGTILHYLLMIMNKVGSAVFDNLPLIFAVGVAIGMAKKEKEVSALSAVIAYFVMNTAINAMLINNGLILENGEIYRLFTCMFLHFGIYHIANNMLVLFVLGQRLEPVVGKIKFILIYLLGGLGGNIFSFIISYT